MVKLYSILDTVTGIYSVPIAHNNDDTARRWFAYVVGQSELVAKDLELYFLCDFNQEQGEIVTAVGAVQPMLISYSSEVMSNEKV